MPTTAFFQERVLTALESLSTQSAAGDGAATLAALVSIDVAQEAILAELGGDTLTAAQASQAALESILTQQTAIKTALESANTAEGSAAFSVTYLFQAQDIGAGNITEVIAGRTGYRGHVRAIEVFNVTEAFTAATTPARVDVGITAGDLDAYAIGGSFGTTAIGTAASPAVSDGVVGTIPVSEDLTITMYQPTGGGEAGIADVAVTIQYFL